MHPFALTLQFLTIVPLFSLPFSMAAFEIFLHEEFIYRKNRLKIPTGGSLFRKDVTKPGLFNFNIYL